MNTPTASQSHSGDNASDTQHQDVLHPPFKVTVISPSRSMTMISPITIQNALATASTLNLQISFSTHAAHPGPPHTPDQHPIEPRIVDLHSTFSDPKVEGILTTIGGFALNQLLPHINFSLIRSNPKFLSGYSDITCLQNALLSCSGLITFSGPHFSTLGMQGEEVMGYTKAELRRFLDRFKLRGKCGLIVGHEGCQECIGKPKRDDLPWLEIVPSKVWRDDEWYLPGAPCVLRPNKGFECIQRGKGEGMLIGGNIDVFNMLRGTPYFPFTTIRTHTVPSPTDPTSTIQVTSTSFNDSCTPFILLLESTETDDYDIFDQLLQSLLLIPNFSRCLKGIVVGRFQVKSQIGAFELKKIIEGKVEEGLIKADVPVMYGADFGHTAPHTLIPIGGVGQVETSDEEGGCKFRVRW
ncbi:hypothetical protein HDV05_007841 [Chytridiales sp. JEL 0842]|nr:hypothetical protein HDV05_007841 [Chytridiales sp. JEL 0842]